MLGSVAQLWDQLSWIGVGDGVEVPRFPVLSEEDYDGRHG